MFYLNQQNCQSVGLYVINTVGLFFLPSQYSPSALWRGLVLIIGPVEVHCAIHPSLDHLGTRQGGLC